MHVFQLIAALVTALLGFPSLAVTGNVVDDLCGVFYQKAITTTRLPLYSDCLDILHNYLNHGITLTLTNPKKTLTNGTCLWSFSLGLGSRMTLNQKYLGNLFDLISAGTTVHDRGDSDGVTRMETHGDVTCGKDQAMNFELYNPYTHTTTQKLSERKQELGVLGGGPGQKINIVDRGMIKAKAAHKVNSRGNEKPDPDHEVYGPGGKINSVERIKSRSEDKSEHKVYGLGEKIKAERGHGEAGASCFKARRHKGELGDQDCTLLASSGEIMKLSQILITLTTGLVALVMAADIGGNRDCNSADVHYSTTSTSGYSPYVPDCWKIVEQNPQDFVVNRTPTTAAWGSCTIRFYVTEGSTITINHQQLLDLHKLIKDNCSKQFPGEEYPRMESHGTITCGSTTAHFDIFQISKQ
ncbi:hypothetical protein QBC43DRAFT_289988 [Cladorrhinum sp. PSN259]|nr:hypothetical protein QBC43DRAFT_289988 [Cladorrhinum sp. PSN259]